MALPLRILPTPPTLPHPYPILDGEGEDRALEKESYLRYLGRNLGGGTRSSPCCWSPSNGAVSLDSTPSVPWEYTEALVSCGNSSCTGPRCPELFPTLGSTSPGDFVLSLLTNSHLGIWFHVPSSPHLYRLLLVGGPWSSHKATAVEEGWWAPSSGPLPRVFSSLPFTAWFCPT